MARRRGVLVVAAVMASGTTTEGQYHAASHCKRQSRQSGKTTNSIQDVQVLPHSSRVPPTPQRPGQGAVDRNSGCDSKVRVKPAHPVQPDPSTRRRVELVPCLRSAQRTRQHWLQRKVRPDTSVNGSANGLGPTGLQGIFSARRAQAVAARLARTLGLGNRLHAIGTEVWYHAIYEAFAPTHA